MSAMQRMYPGVRLSFASPIIPDLKTICCECGVTIREGAEPVSHGYCKPCADAYRAANGLKPAPKAPERSDA